MKILQVISIIGILLNPIKTDKYKTITNNTNQLIFDGSQVSYTYTCEEVGATVGGSIAGFVSAEVFVPSVFVCNICIQLLQPVDFANIKMTFTMPVTNNYHLNYIMENARVVTASRTQLDIQAFNTDTVNVKLYFSINQLLDDYYFSQTNALDYSEEWVLNGSNYFDIISIQLNSATQSTDPNYSSQLTSLMNNTDSIESLLQSVVTNTAYLSTISTNINTLKTTLNNIYTLVNSMSTSVTNQSYLFKNTNGIMCSIDNTVKNIGYMFSGNYQEYISSDFVTQGTGPSAPTYAVVYDPANNINSNYDKNKIKIVIKINTNTDNTYYYFNVPLNDSDTIIQSTETLMTYNINSQLFNRITITFYVSNNFVAFNIAAWQTSPSGSFSPGTATWTVVNNCYSTDANISTEEILYSIEELLSNMSGNVNIDTTDKTTVDNWYDQLEQSLDFPLVDREHLTQGFQKMGKIIKYYGMLINNSEWVLLPKIILISAMFKLFGVVIS